MSRITQMVKKGIAILSAGIRGIEIEFLVLVVGQACTLKCKECGTLSPYAPRNMSRYSFDLLKSNLDVLLNHACRISKLQIQGGEPFLYGELKALLIYLLASDKIMKIEIATNGTIVPPQDMANVLSNPRVFIRASAYGNIKTKVRLLEVYLQADGIQHRIYNFATNDGTWYDQGGVDVPRENSDAIVKKRFDDCPFSRCLTLESSTIGYCSRSTVAPFVQRMAPPPTDYVHVTRNPWFGIKLANYVARPHFMECCRYCRGAGGEKVAPAI